MLTSSTHTLHDASSTITTSTPTDYSDLAAGAVPEQAKDAVAHGAFWKISDQAETGIAHLDNPRQTISY